MNYESCIQTCVFNCCSYDILNINLVCVLSESLDELSEMVIPLFSPVENKSVDIPFWSEGPYGPEHVKVSLKMMSSTNFYIRLIIHSLVLEITRTL